MMYSFFMIPVMFVFDIWFRRIRMVSPDPDWAAGGVPLPVVGEAETYRV